MDGMHSDIYKTRVFESLFNRDNTLSGNRKRIFRSASNRIALSRTPELAETPFLFPIAHNHAAILARINGKISK